MANETKTTDIAAFITEYNQRSLMPIVRNETVLTRLADVETFPMGNGTQAVLRRRLPLEVITSTTGEAADPTPVQFDGMKITCDLVALTNAVKPSRLLKNTDFNQLRDIRDLVALNMAESLEKYNIDQISPYLLHYRADGDSTYQKAFLATSDGAAGGTTTISTTLTEVDYHWGGNSTIGYLTCIGRRNKNYGVTVKTSDFTASSDTITHAAFPNQTKSGDRFWICIGTGLTTNDKITIDKLMDMQAFFEDEQIKGASWQYPIAGGYGNRLLLGARDKRDIFKDTDWKAYQQYKARSDMFDAYRIGNLVGMDPLGYSQEYRESAAGAGSATAALRNVLALNKHCFTRLVLTAPHVETVMGPDSYNFLKRWFIIAWELEHAIGVTNSMAGMTLLTVPTTGS